MKVKTKFKETEIGMIPEDWEVANLGDIADILTGFPFDGSKYSFDAGTLVVRGENLAERNFRWDTPKRWKETDEEMNRYQLEANVAVLSMDGNVGKNKAIVKKEDLPLLLAQRVARVKTKDGNNQDFINQVLLSDLFLRYCEQIKTGTTISHISKKQIEQFKIPLPSLLEQTAIAKILSDLDEKIDLNRRMNKTLEAIGQAIFKHWFVDFEFPNEKGKPYKSSGGEMVYKEELKKEIPKWWKVEGFNDLGINLISGSWGNDFLSEKFKNKVKCIRGTDIPEFQKGNYDSAPIRYLSNADYQKSLLIKGDVVVEISGGSGMDQSTGRTAIITKELKNFAKLDIICSNFCKILRPNNQSDGLYIYSYLRYLYDKGIFFNFEIGTVGIKNLDLKYFINNYKIIIPEIPIKNKFIEIVSILVSKIMFNGKQIETLSQIRDVLLPKLMSGKIRVPLEEKDND